MSSLKDIDLRQRSRAGARHIHVIRFSNPMLTEQTESSTKYIEKEREETPPERCATKSPSVPDIVRSIRILHFGISSASKMVERSGLL